MNASTDNIGRSPESGTDVNDRHEEYEPLDWESFCSMSPTLAAKADRDIVRINAMDWLGTIMASSTRITMNDISPFVGHAALVESGSYTAERVYHFFVSMAKSNYPSAVFAEALKPIIAKWDGLRSVEADNWAQRNR